MLTRRSSDWTSTLPAKLSPCPPEWLSASPVHEKAASSFFLTFKVANKFNHSNLPTISKTCLSPCCVPPLTMHSTRGHLSNCPVYCCYSPASRHRCVLTMLSDSALLSHFTLAWPLHITCSLSGWGCMQHDHLHTRCRFTSRPCSHELVHTQPYCILSLGHTLGLTVRARQSSHKLRNTLVTT